MTTAIPPMLGAGAAIVFVTERDNLTGPYASEGVLQSVNPLTADPWYTRRPSFYAVRALADRNGRHALTDPRRALPPARGSDRDAAPTSRPSLRLAALPGRTERWEVARN